MVQTRYKAKVGDQTYTIIGKETKQHMDLVIKVVNEQLAEIHQLSQDIDQEQAAILLAINAISDQVKKQAEIITLQKKITELEKQVEHLPELENRVKKIEAVEAEAKEILRKQGQTDVELDNHVTAQQIVNEAHKKEIKKKR
ncbi:cell division protein ZapA [Enterococcus sp. CSURQ0835]|uniref:cell division protein ZapA n=1 Tax=Enterococcus sp. CSURQ0835 TaxID=2681394 RepID=UPI0013595512|nr:cell division protein ZapA [Enterococcus sp. CSURQ0835]